MHRYFFPFLILLMLTACDKPADSAPEAPLTSDAPENPVSTGNSDTTADAAKEDVTPEQSLEDMQSRLKLKVLTEPWSGDLDGMVKRRVIRVLTVYGIGRYFLDGPQEKGIAYEMFKGFETSLNKELKTGPLAVHVIFIPVSRDELLPGLLNGRGDIAAAGLTITPERLALVDFSNPVSKEIKEVLVTGPSAPAVTSLDDLAGQTVHVRFSSSYYQSLQALSKKLQEAGKTAIDIQPISELLEDEDLLEMVQGGLLPWVVVDDYKARTWGQVFDKLVVHPDLVLRTGGLVGYAFRKNSPELAAKLNEYLKTHSQGTLLGNVVFNRYLKDFDWAKNALNPDDFSRFEKVVNIFQKYGEEYGFDYLMVTAQGYQESGLDQNVSSKVGAVGIMQLLPSTAADPNVGIPDIHKEDPNIQAGIKYLAFIRDRYFNDPGMDRFNRTLMAFASYNAGPARVASLREKAKEQGLDPNVWFGNVEVVAAREIGRETVQYVSNIFKYYTAYRMIAEKETSRQQERKKQKLN